MCNQCDKRFMRSDHLTKHMRTHKKTGSLTSEGTSGAGVKDEKPKNDETAEGHEDEEGEEEEEDGANGTDEEDDDDEEEDDGGMESTDNKESISIEDTKTIVATHINNSLQMSVLFFDKTGPVQVLDGTGQSGD